MAVKIVIEGNNLDLRDLETEYLEDILQAISNDPNDINHLRLLIEKELKERNENT